MKFLHYKLIPYINNEMLNTQWDELLAYMGVFRLNSENKFILEYAPKDILYFMGLLYFEKARRKLIVKSDLLADIKLVYNYYRFNYPDLYKDKTPEQIFNHILSATEKKSKEDINPFENHHTKRYLVQCYFKLQEYYDEHPDIEVRDDELLKELTHFMAKNFSMSFYDVMMFI